MLGDASRGCYDCTTSRHLIDPPNGHAFGFPKPFDGDISALDFDIWLLDNGYPEEWVKMFPNGKGGRILTYPVDNAP